MSATAPKKRKLSAPPKRLTAFQKHVALHHHTPSVVSAAVSPSTASSSSSSSSSAAPSSSISAVSASNPVAASVAAASVRVTYKMKYESLQKDYERTLRELKLRTELNEKMSKESTGWDKAKVRIESEILTCAITSDKMQAPVAIPECQHVFEFSALKSWAHSKLKESISPSVDMKTALASRAVCPLCRQQSTRQVQNLPMCLPLVSLFSIMYPDVKLDWTKIERPIGPESNTGVLAKVVSATAQPMSSSATRMTGESLREKMAVKKREYDLEFAQSEFWCKKIFDRIAPKIHQELDREAKSEYIFTVETLCETRPTAVQKDRLDEYLKKELPALKWVFYRDDPHGNDKLLIMKLEICLHDN